MQLSLLHGMRLRLERATDMKDNYCTMRAVIRVEDGADRAELRCALCGRHRAWLSQELAKWLIALVTHFPATKDETITIRDKHEDRANEIEQDSNNVGLWSRGEGKDNIRVSLP